jgi:hypothetical protein
MLVIVVLADQCHGLHYKTRITYGAEPPSRVQSYFNKAATVVVLLPTMTEECDGSSCSRVVRSKQYNDMQKKSMNDLGEK